MVESETAPGLPLNLPLKFSFVERAKKHVTFALKHAKTAQEADRAAGMYRNNETNNVLEQCEYSSRAVNHYYFYVLACSLSENIAHI